MKIAIVVLAALLVLLGINAVVTGKETEPAEVREPGGRILELTGGSMQVVDRGPRDGPAVVLIHCFTCAIDWWDRMMPRLEQEHRVVAVDLLGHGGSEKPDSGYSIPNQADLVAQALAKLGVSDATVVGHSLGGAVAVAVAEQSPKLVGRIVIIGTPPEPDEDDLGTLAGLAFTPVIGEGLWRIKPDFAVRDGLGVAFAPGFDVPDEFVEDVNAMTYSAYDESHDAFAEYTDVEPLDQRVRGTGKPLLVIMGDEEQVIDDPRAAIDEYGEAVPTSFGNLIRGVGHSPNVEEPSLTTTLVIGFVGEGERGARQGVGMQKRMQNRDAVRSPS